MLNNKKLKNKTLFKNFKKMFIPIIFFNKRKMTFNKNKLTHIKASTKCKIRNPKLNAPHYFEREKYPQH